MPDSIGLRRWLLLLAVALLSLCAGLGQGSLWEPDEPRFAETARQMLERGDWLTPWFDGRPRFEKPPALYWAQAAAIGVLGPSELAARLPVALAGLGCVWLTAAIGGRLLGGQAGWLAGLALATLLRFVSYSRHALTDVPLLLCLELTLYAWLRAEAGPAGRWAALGGWAALGVGLLVKGPVALLALAVWLAFVLLAREPAGLRRLRWPAGVALSLALAAPWYLAMLALHGRAWLDVAIGKELAARVADQSFSRLERGFFWYLKVWPGDAAPWSLFALAALALCAWRWRRLDPARRRGLLFALVWAGVVLLLFSLPRYKLPHYILPLYPALALLVGWFVDATAERRLPWWPLALAGWVTALLCVAGVPLLGLFLGRGFGAAPADPSWLVPLALLTGAVGMLVSLRKRHPLGLHLSLAAGLAAVWALTALFVLPRHLERYKPLRPLALRVLAESPSAPLGVFGTRGQSLTWYARRPLTVLHTPGQLEQFMAAGEPRYAVLRGEEPALEPLAAQGAEVIERRAVFDLRLRHLLAGRRDERQLVLVANRAALEASRGSAGGP